MRARSRREESSHQSRWYYKNKSDQTSQGSSDDRSLRSKTPSSSSSGEVAQPRAEIDLTVSSNDNACESCPLTLQDPTSPVETDMNVSVASSPASQTDENADLSTGDVVHPLLVHSCIFS